MPRINDCIYGDHEGRAREIANDRLHSERFVCSCGEVNEVVKRAVFFDSHFRVDVNGNQLIATIAFRVQCQNYPCNQSYYLSYSSDYSCIANTKEYEFIGMYKN